LIESRIARISQDKACIAALWFNSSHINRKGPFLDDFVNIILRKTK
jgi:hypothetical protein